MRKLLAPLLLCIAQATLAQQPVISVKTFGAKCDNATDDYAAITKALTYAGALVTANAGYGVQVQVGPGQCKTGTTVTPPTGVWLVGPGQLIPNGVSPVIKLNQLRQRITGLTVLVPDNGVGIQVLSHYTKIDHNWFMPQNGAGATNATMVKLDSTNGSDGSWITDVNDNVMDFNQAATATGVVAIDLFGPANRINIERNTIAGFGGIGIRLSAFKSGIRPQMVNIRGNDIESLGGAGPNYGIQLAECYNVTIEGNYFEAIATAGSYYIKGGHGPQPTRVLSIQDNYMTTGAGAPVAIGFDQVIGFHIGQNYWDGAAGTYITITANTAMAASAIQPQPLSTVDLLDSAATAFQAPGGAFATPTVARQVSGLAFNENIYSFCIYYGASGADTYSFQVNNQGGAGYATIDHTAPGAGNFSACTLFEGVPGNPLVQFKAAAGGQIKLYQATIQSQ